MFDCDKAVTRCSGMWLRIGRVLAAKALENAERGYGKTAVELARMADACFWQATGENDSISMADLFSKDGDK